MHAPRAGGLADGRVYVVGLALATGISCGSAQRTPLAKAGTEKDEGAGDLARASLHLTTRSDQEPEGFAAEPQRRQRWEANYPYAYGGAIYGGDPYGGAQYGGVGYANWVIPQWSYSQLSRAPRYNVVGGLGSSIEGVVTWAGAAPTKITTACGLVDNPTLRVGTDKGLPGVVVYIEKVASGRPVPYYARQIAVGGTLAKRGCTIVPSTQIVSPLPGPLTIHGDEARAKLKLTVDKAAPVTHEMQEGGFVQIEAKPGVTKVESDDGTLSPAWVIGVDTPYYAVTDDTGRYRIDELAPGTYELTFWHAPVATTNAKGVWSHGTPIVVKRTVKVGAKTANLSVTLR
jgi:hypothetical protein